MFDGDNDGGCLIKEVVEKTAMERNRERERREK